MTPTQLRTAINRELRRQSLSRAELARRIGWSRQRVTNMLNGTGEYALTESHALTIWRALRPGDDPLRKLLS